MCGNEFHCSTFLFTLIIRFKKYNFMTFIMMTLPSSFHGHFLLGMLLESLNYSHFEKKKPFLLFYLITFSLFYFCSSLPHPLTLPLPSLSLSFSLFLTLSRPCRLISFFLFVHCFKLLLLHSFSNSVSLSLTHTHKPTQHFPTLHLSHSLSFLL